MKRDLPYIAVALRRARHAAQFSQHQLAERAAISRPTIANIELGAHADVRTDTVRKLAKALNIPMSDLLGPGDEEVARAVAQFVQSPLGQELVISTLEAQWLLAICDNWPAGKMTPHAFYLLIEALRHSAITGKIR